MDRTAWTAVIIATIGLLASIYWQQHQMAEARAKFLQQQAVLAAQATPTTTPLSPTPNTAAPTTNPTSAQDVDKKIPTTPDQVARLKSDVAELHFSNNRGGLSSVSLLQHSAEQGQVVQLNTDHTTAIGAITQ